MNAAVQAILLKYAQPSTTTQPAERATGDDVD